MKYRLKKDLFPYGRIGEKVHLMESHLDESNFTVEKSPKEGLRIWYRNIPKLLKEGWIEEVKPREYWIEILADGFARVVDRPPYNKNPFEYIKVREVIE